MLANAISLTLIGVGIIHILPISGVLGQDRLSALYGIQLRDPDLEVLMRHRALLFGILGALLITAAWRSELRFFALASGFVSVTGFIWLARPTQSSNPKLHKIVQADWLALALLLVATGGMLLQGRI